MADRVVSMEARLAVAVSVMVDDGTVDVSLLCRRLKISRDTYYRYRRRFLESGLPGLMPVSSRPASSPGQTPPEVASLIVALRQELLEKGWDAGARSIRYRLKRQGVQNVPTARTVHRVLVRAGLVSPQPAKRPRSSYRRFEHRQPNACWQMDGTTWILADKTPAWILRITDDHSRMIMASLACEAENNVNAWTCMNTAISRHGAPAMLLSDGGPAFGHRRIGGGLGVFEARLRALGINPVVSSPFHPQTCGKKERDWQPLKRWLTAQPAAHGLIELQRLLDVYDALFNTDRPHQALQGDVPAERYAASPKATPSAEPIAPPCTITYQKTAPNGAIRLGNGYRLSIGRSWAGVEVTVVRDNLDVIVLHKQTLIANIRIDPNRRYQSNGRPHRRSHNKQILSEPS
ncbi:MAG TPA: DDE-type integrase/transposase/recombinase [Actinomycetes bacterium]|nr:DDE-type integrase/transposase/recombinase [Actinomycetes bacterium]